MLINDFFNIIKIENTDKSILSSIQLNASHQIFKGHFPDNPVTPGVVQLQIIKEILEKALGKECLLKEVGRCKFMAVLNPNEHPEILIKIDYQLDAQTLKVSAMGSSLEKDQVFFKFNARYA
jgi:3-hydroxyacyl-[acyl-carrier-protein] dehydratase